MDNTNKHKTKSGFTLIEIMVVLAIISVLSLAVQQFVIQGNKLFIQSRDQALAQNSLRKVTESIARELRSAEDAGDGNYMLVEASGNSISFYSNIDDDFHKERIRYFLSGTDFIRGEMNTPSVIETTEIIVSNVRNVEPVFAYFDENYTGTEAPLPEPINLGNVRLVSIKLTIDSDPNKPPEAISISTSIMIRNLKTNY